MLDLKSYSEARAKELLTGESSTSHLAFHVKILMSFASNWLEYIDYLSTEWREHVSYAAVKSCL
jgi:hypothetical protein